jgi:hypothetical protein
MQAGIKQEGCLLLLKLVIHEEHSTQTFQYKLVYEEYSKKF